MLTVLIISLCSVVTIVSLAARMHKKAFSIIRGHNALFDVLFTIGLATFMATSGSLTGLMISAVTGVLLSVVLMGSSKLFGGSKLKNPEFVWFKPTTWFKFSLSTYAPVVDFGWNTKLVKAGIV